MLQLTKVFHFETAHAIFGYEGQCRNIHGHSYELHVTVGNKKADDGFISAPGFVFDFKDLKKAGNEIVETLDHKIVLSNAYLNAHPYLRALENLVIWDFEPTAENILLYIKEVVEKNLPAGMVPLYLKIYETKNSYAEWVADPVKP
jgi:6-pyruvoyltetrahydropterin/6-carboxytetrahydropterin synthase